MISFNYSINKWQDDKTGYVWLPMIHMNPVNVYTDSDLFLEEYRDHFLFKKEKYVFRDYPQNIKNDDPYGIRWCIVGTYPGAGTGVLEWCTSFEDACMIRDKMTYLNLDYNYSSHVIRISIADNMYGLFHNPNLNYDKKLKLRFGVGDKVAVYFDLGAHYSVGTVVAIREGSSYHTGIELKVEYSTRLEKYGPDRANSNNIEYYDSVYVFNIIDRSKIKQRNSNGLRTPDNDNFTFNIFRTGNVFDLICHELSKLSYNIRNVNFVLNMDNMFTKLYPQKKSGKINKKLLRSWVKRNHMKIFMTQKDSDQECFMIEQEEQYQMSRIDEEVDGWYEPNDSYYNYIYSAHDIVRL